MKRRRALRIAGIVATIGLAPLATTLLPDQSPLIISSLEFLSEVAILLLILTSPAAVRSRARFFTISIASLFIADTLYSLRVLKVIDIPLNGPLNIGIECLYGVFMVGMLAAVIRGLGGIEALYPRRILHFLLFTGALILNTKFVIIPYCLQSHPDLLRVNTVIYGIASSLLLAIALPFAIGTTERFSHWFLQFLTMFLIADFAIRYQAVVVNITYFSWAEPGWCAAFVGLAWLCFFSRKKLSFLELNGGFSPMISIRTLLTLAICGGNIVFLLAGLLSGVHTVRTGGDLSGVFFLLYLFWFVSNEFSIWLAGDFQTILPRMFQSTKHLSPDGTLNLRLERVRTKTSIYEISQMLESYNGLVEQENKLIDLSRQMTRDKALVEIATQVSHDIRSPLSVLNMLCATVKEMGEERRDLMKNALTRINDIANDLLQRYKNLQTSPAKEPRLLAVEIDQIVSEKRLQFGGRIQIRTNFGRTGHAFVEMEAKEFKRVISNLINNSYEAFFSGTGNAVEIEVDTIDARSVKVSIKDNGPGIPAEVLERLNSSEVISTKEAGFGLGLPHARKTIATIGGHLEILSTLGQGTVIVLLLPKAATPEWFCEKIVLEPDAQIGVLDDDSSIHGAWNQRLQNIPHASFAKGAEFKRWCAETNGKTVFLVDYELILQPQSGLDIIEEMGIASRTILVTSRFDDSMVRDRCQRLKIKILPKIFIASVPVLRREAFLNQSH